MESKGLHMCAAYTHAWCTGKYKQAEQLYVAGGQPNKAIAMYKQATLWEDMMRLVEEHHPDHVIDTHLHVARELEQRGEYALAEKHFLAGGGEWKLAAAMYRNAQQWEHAHRVSTAQLFIHTHTYTVGQSTRRRSGRQASGHPVGEKSRR